MNAHSFQGFASVVRFRGLRIGGWSGIYKPEDYNLSHFEAPPFRGARLISAYHVRSLEHFRLKQLAVSRGGGSGECYLSCQCESVNYGLV